VYKKDGYSQAPNQPQFNYHLFSTKLHNWLVDVPPANLDVTGSLPEPLQVVQRFGHSGVTHVKCQLDDFWAASGSVGWHCPTLRLSVKAPGGLYPWHKTPTVHLYVPVVLRSTLSVDDVREAFTVAAWDLLQEQDSRETLRGQPLVRRLVGVTPLAPVVSWPAHSVTGRTANCCPSSYDRCYATFSLEALSPSSQDIPYRKVVHLGLSIP
jgi:hypothetical protein